jgi:hypothetical protein
MAIDHLLKKQKCRPTDQVPNEDESRFGASGTRRAILISTPVHGWVSVLDSDLAGEFELANDLAERLNAYSLIVLVNDSDSWGYSLARGDGPLDSFGLDDEDAPGEPIGEIFGGEVERITDSLAKLQAAMSDGTYLERIQKMFEDSLAQASAEMQALYARVQAQQATPEEMQQFIEWNTSVNAQYMEQVQRMLKEEFNLPEIGKAFQTKSKKKRKRKPTKAQLAAARQRIDNLRPLLLIESTDEEIQELMGRKAVFAEETLAEFLPRFGIPPFYAYLDYGHHSEASAEELAAHAIRFVHHLKYETDV